MARNTKDVQMARMSRALYNQAKAEAALNQSTISMVLDRALFEYFNNKHRGAAPDDVVQMSPTGEPIKREKKC